MLVRGLLLIPALAVVSTLPAQRTATPTDKPQTTAQAALGSPLPAGGKTPAGITWKDRMLVDASRQDLPYIHEIRPLGYGTVGFSAHLTDTRYEALTEAEMAGLPGLGKPGAQPEVLTMLGIERKRPTALVDIYPYRRNEATGRIERLTHYRLELVEERKAGGGGRPKSGTYPEHSKMASGQWYRFSVPQDGVYKLTYSFLQALGIDMGGMESDRINVYGNHAGQLPFKNSPFLPTDLLANAVEMVDGGDGQFGPNDHILFYASGPHNWSLNAVSGRFVHTKNVYTDSASYFIGIDVDPPKRIVDVVQSNDPATDQMTAFTDHQFIDRDLLNLLKSGRTWVGESYDLTTTYNYNFSVPFLRASEPYCLAVSVVSRTIGSGNSSTWNVSAGTDQFSFLDSGISGNYAGLYADTSARVFCATSSASNLPITVSFDKYDPISSMGWMNYLALNARRDLKMTGDQLAFRDPLTVGAGRIADISLDLSSNVQRIWEITDPSNAGNVAFATNGTLKTFRLATDSLREFIAFTNNNYLVPVPIGPSPTQDLHATTLPTDLVIICPSQFMGEAQRLANRRAEEGLSVVMVTPQQVYNEFSSGQRDVTAFKRYMRMLYDRAGSDPLLIPRYLLLFGDGSFNNWSLAESNQNLIPTYQSAESLLPSGCYTTDDYMCLLDDNEGDAVSDLIDMGVGRLPVSNITQAREMVDKILNYDQLILGNGTGSSCASGSDGGAADWRNWVLFASDDQSGDGYEGVIHMSQSESLATEIEIDHPCLNQAKVYMDAYAQVSTPGGQRYPDAEIALRDRVQKGVLLVNYVGHGGEVGWAHERFLDNQTILGWTNLERLPLFVTATCEFSRWDDPSRTSAGEYVMLNPSGGGIGLMTTTRIAYSGANFALCQVFYDHVFQELEENGRTMRFGDIYRQTKLNVSSSTNYRNFCLIGDPSIRLALARNDAHITAITDTLGVPVDTLEALATVRISGEVTDTTGQLLSDLNGIVLPTVFDKKVTVNTLANDAGASPFTFGLRKNIIYRGRASVVNGQFSFTFVVPKDINYQVGPGRISIYVENPQTNACGYSNDPLVGGSDENAVADEQGPRIDLFMNDERFVNGGITNEDPLLLAKLFDENGINTLGNSIGHDLTAIIDGATDDALVLNDVYEADMNTYQSGQVRYRLSDLEEGSHTLALKAWDVHNNSSQRSLEFVVAPSAEMALDHVLNYPNPFTTHTEFYFEHNRPCGNLDVRVQVFTVAGRLVKTLNNRLACDGFRSEPMPWDGLDDFGDKLGRGVYVYRLSVATEAGETADHVDKLVILR